MIQSGRSVRLASLILLTTSLLFAGCASQKPLPEHPEGVDYYVQGVQLNKSGKIDQAIDMWEKAVIANPKLRMAHVMLGDAYRSRGDYSRAAVHYDAATKLDRYSFSNHYNLGVAYQMLNRLEEAATAYLSAIELNPRDVKSNMNLGLVYLALGKNDSAVTFLDRATKLDPSYGPARSNLGVALDARGDLMAAESNYRKALELDSKNLVTQQNLAQNLISQKKTSEALTIMEHVLTQTDSPAAHKRYGDALAQARKFDQATAQMDIALKADPTYIPAINGKADVLILQYTAGLELDDKLRMTALDLWRSSLKMNPNQPGIAESIKKWTQPGLFGN
ncbi:MAG TPA: tetratricopeptide repeat protein [Tepidisphaeraceae bacterium]|nr:tetratricopeptide repeat protein [Tepidisphaeraceae bacterium]